MLKDPYFEHLKLMAFGKDFKKYELLCMSLYSRNFEYILDMDENRITDALEMRREFENTNRAQIEKPCSVLEVLLALANRCDSTIIDDSTEESSDLFMLMMNNMGLLKYTNAMFDPDGVEARIDVFIDRKYDKDGLGGPFYIPGIDKDMREVDLWYQAMWYIDAIIN